jgi:hypothetical protein
MVEGLNTQQEVDALKILVGLREEAIKKTALCVVEPPDTPGRDPTMCATHGVELSECLERDLAVITSLLARCYAGWFIGDNIVGPMQEAGARIPKAIKVAIAAERKRVELQEKKEADRDRAERARAP